MPEPTLSETFGANATQNATSVTIDKTPMSEYSLTPSASNKAEGLLTGMIAVASKNLTETNRALDRENRHLTVNYAGFDVIEDPVGSGQYYRRDIWTVIAYKSQPNTPFDLDDY